jgi:hypothetical protein
MKEKREMRKNWQLGFLGLMAVQGFDFFTTKNWTDLIWFIWIVWFVSFIPVRRK